MGWGEAQRKNAEATAAPAAAAAAGKQAFSRQKGNGFTGQVHDFFALSSPHGLPFPSSLSSQYWLSLCISSLKTFVTKSCNSFLSCLLAS